MQSSAGRCSWRPFNENSLIMKSENNLFYGLPHAGCLTRGISGNWQSNSILSVLYGCRLYGCMGVHRMCQLWPSACFMAALLWAACPAI
ncbi:Hypothetical protein GbCGDNIH6_8298 [Granulibacter bethesdensis]|nr:Hypothetical protein GbCGDNIH6_8298 [Granulibacter bethesdensis]